MKAFSRSLPHKYSVRVFETNILQEYSIRGNIIDYNDVSLKAFSNVYDISILYEYSVWANIKVYNNAFTVPVLVAPLQFQK